MIFSLHKAEFYLVSNSKGKFYFDGREVYLHVELSSEAIRQSKKHEDDVR